MSNDLDLVEVVEVNGTQRERPIIRSRNEPMNLTFAKRVTQFRRAGIPPGKAILKAAREDGPGYNAFVAKGGDLNELEPPTPKSAEEFAELFMRHAIEHGRGKAILFASRKCPDGYNRYLERVEQGTAVQLSEVQIPVMA